MKSRNIEANEARAALGDARCRSIWESTLADICNCYADSEGNHPCDNGLTCCKCMQEWVAEEYTNRVIIAGGGQIDKTID